MLTIKQIENLTPAEGKNQTKYSDSFGLVLLVHKNGGKYWQYNYRFLGKQKTMSLGTFPDTTLKSARDKRDDAKKLIRDDIDPMQEKKALLNSAQNQNHTFEVLAEEWIH